MTTTEGGAEAVESTEELAPEGTLETPEAEHDEDDEIDEARLERILSKRKFKAKVDQEEREFTFAELRENAQLKQASHKRMQEAAAARKQAEDEIAQVRALAAQTRQDPRVLFKALGLDARAFAEALLTEEIQNDLRTPEEKELIELRLWKQKQDEEATEAKNKAAEKEAEALAQQAGVEIESEIVDALKSSGLKATPRTVARVAEMILASLEGEGPRMKASDALLRLKPEYRSDVVELLEAEDPETLEREYPSLYKKILQHAANKNSSVPTFQRGIGQKSSASAPRKPKSWEEWMKD